MDTRTKETIRYLGYGKHAVDDRSMTLIQDALQELDRSVKGKIVYRIFDVVHHEEGVTIGKMDILSKNLKKNLKKCRQVIVLGATLGIEVDNMLKRYSILDMSKAVILQAAAAATLEEFLNQWQQELKLSMEKEGHYLRPRFSPGYGDFDIQHQRMLLRMIEAEKKIGLTVTDSSMLTPTKSVTAIIGISDQNDSCPLEGCEICGKKDCVFRRNGDLHEDSGRGEEC